MKKVIKESKVIKKPTITKKVINNEVIEEKKVIISDSTKEVLESISHPNKKILAQKILDGVSFDTLAKDYGRTRVLEMQKYIQVYSDNLNKDCELTAKRGRNGVCIACQR